MEKVNITIFNFQEKYLQINSKPNVDYFDNLKDGYFNQGRNQEGG